LHRDSTDGSADALDFDGEFIDVSNGFDVPSARNERSSDTSDQCSPYNPQDNGDDCFHAEKS